MALLNQPQGGPGILSRFLSGIFGQPSEQHGGFRPGALAMIPSIVASAFDPMNTGRYIAQGGANMAESLWRANQDEETRKYRDLRTRAAQFDLDQAQQAATQQQGATNAARDAWDAPGTWQPTMSVPVTPRVDAPNYQQARQGLDAANLSGTGTPALLDTVPAHQRPFWRAVAEADPLGALKLYGEQTTLAANQPPQERLETFGPDADPYGQGGYGQLNPVTGQISGYQKPPAPEKPAGPQTEIAKLHQDYTNGLIDKDQYLLGIRGIQAEIAQRMRGPADRAPSGLVSVQMPNGGRVRSFRQDDPELDAALRSGAFQVNAAVPGLGGGQQGWRIPMVNPSNGLGPSTYIPPDADFRNATGLGGMFSNAFNRAFDMVGIAPPFRDNMTATEALNTADIHARTILQDAVPGRPSNYLIQEMDKMVVKPNSPWRGPAGARERLQQTRDFLSRAADQIERDVLGNPGGYTRAQLGTARQKVPQLREMVRAYEQLLQTGSTGGNTSGQIGGVGWRIVE